MKRQMSFAEAESAGKKRVTRRQRFLDEMDKLVPWSRLLTAIERTTRKELAAGCGRFMGAVRHAREKCEK